MRGEVSAIGDKRITQNRYHQTRTEEGWRYDHHLIAEQALGRPLLKDERVKFIDGDKNNLKPSNLLVTPKKKGSKNARRAMLEAKIAELQLELDELDNS
jgi:hypothetical protein